MELIFVVLIVLAVLGVVTLGWAELIGVVALCLALIWFLSMGIEEK